jgi:hypothetical protein
VIPDPGTNGRLSGIPLVADLDARELASGAEFEGVLQGHLRREFAFLEQGPDRLEIRGIKWRNLGHGYALEELAMTLLAVFAVAGLLPLFLPVYDVDFLLHGLPHKMGNGGVLPYRQLLNLIPHFHWESDTGQGLFHRF